MSSSAYATHLAFPHVPPGPLAASVALVTMPFWRERLAEWSRLAADFAPLLGLAIGLLTLWNAIHTRDADGISKAKKSATAHAIEAAGSAARKGGAVAVAGVAIVAIFSLVAGLLANKDSRALAVASTTALVAPKRRKSADDAGEDGEDDSELDASGAPKWYASALAMRGVHEGTKRKPNPEVQKLFADAGFPSIKDTTGTAWCAAFVGAHLQRAGHSSGKTLAARGFETYGVKLDKPRLGCIVVMWRNSPKSWTGHVGFYVKEDATHVYVLGGNQSDAVTVAKFPKSRVLCYRWPRKLVDTTTAKAAAVAAGGSAVSVGAQITDKLAPVKETVDALEPLKAPLAETGWPWAVQAAAWIGVAMAAVAVIGAIWAIWGRKRALRNAG